MFSSNCSTKILQTFCRMNDRLNFLCPKNNLKAFFSKKMATIYFLSAIYFLTHICWNKPTDVVLEGLKLYPPYTRSVLRPILAHTSLNAQPIKRIGQAVHQAITNSGRNTVWTLGGDRLLATETHHVTCKGDYILFDPY